jgi:hypothetical protein
VEAAAAIGTTALKAVREMLIGVVEGVKDVAGAALPSPRPRPAASAPSAKPEPAPRDDVGKPVSPRAKAKDKA